MAEVDSGTLITTIQAIEMAIRQQEKMLDAELIGNRADTEEFLFILEKAKEKLRQVYAEECKLSDNLPAYETLLSIRI